MSLKHLKIADNVEETKTDVLPGSNFTAETGLYPMIIDVAYMDISDSGAEAMKLHLKMADGSPAEVRTAFWVASGDKKGNSTTYTTKQGKVRNLPGFIQASQVAQIAAGKALEDLAEDDTKVIKLWNSANQAEENTTIRCLTELLNKPILVGVIKIRDNKMVKGDTGYEKVAEERIFNEVDKVFYSNGISITEFNAGVTEPEFNERWVKRYPTDFVADRYTAVAGSQPDLPAHTAPAAPVSSLFSKNTE
jgi:hypothetical protein